MTIADLEELLRKYRDSPNLPVGRLNAMELPRLEEELSADESDDIYLVLIDEFLESVRGERFFPVLQLIGDGKSDKEIALAIRLPDRTYRHQRVRESALAALRDFLGDRLAEIRAEKKIRGHGDHGSSILSDLGCIAPRNALQLPFPSTQIAQRLAARLAVRTRGALGSLASVLSCQSLFPD